MLEKYECACSYVEFVDKVDKVLEASVEVRLRPHSDDLGIDIQAVSCKAFVKRL